MNVSKQILRNDHHKRTNREMDWNYITVHNTGNPKSTAQNERDWLDNPKNTGMTAWHYVADQKEVIQAIPDNEICYHAGDGKNGLGNTTSIGVEICEFGDFEVSLKRAVQFIALKLHEKNKGIESVTTHNRWIGKNCPSLLLPRWQEFLNMIQKELDLLNKPVSNGIVKWKQVIIQDALDSGLLTDSSWLEKADEPAPVWMVVALINKLK